MSDLDMIIKGEAQPDISYDPIPEGEYRLKIVAIEPWKEVSRNVKKFLVDEKNNRILDEKGKPKFEMIKDHKMHETNVRLEVVGGKYEGKLVFHRLTTHPNLTWIIPSFIDAIGEKEMRASEIPTKAIGRIIGASVIIEEYESEKEKTDKTTGMVSFEKQTRKINKIKKVYPDVTVASEGANLDFNTIK